MNETTIINLYFQHNNIVETVKNKSLLQWYKCTMNNNYIIKQVLIFNTYLIQI